MTVSVNPAGPQRGMLVIKLTGVASTDSGGQGEVANPEGVTLGITRAFAYFVTGSTGAGNLDIGVGASGAKCTDICSTMDVIQATVGGKFIYMPAAQVAETESPTAKWTASTYLTFTGSNTLVGLVGYLFVEYIRLPAS